MRRAQIVALGAMLAACGRGVLAADASQSATFADLFSIFAIVIGIAFVLVMAFLAAALLRRRETAEEWMKPMFFGWVAFIVLGLSGLALASFFTDRSLAAAETRRGINVTVTANQWWWSVEYDHPDVSKTLHTANELHLPLGVPVHLKLQSTDVIHSLWIPELAGKQDLIPGRVTDLTITPRRAGLYRGRCAEFCGAQHGHMGLDVTVEPVDQFRRWWAAGLKPAASPADPRAAAGYAYVTTRECSTCHSIAGTPASANVGPDLTHFASRRSIAAGTLPMSRANIRAWVADPQAQKPGTRMPNLRLKPDTVDAITAYLETLK